MGVKEEGWRLRKSLGAWMKHKGDVIPIRFIVETSSMALGLYGRKKLAEAIRGSHIEPANKQFSLLLPMSYAERLIENTNAKAIQDSQGQ